MPDFISSNRLHLSLMLIAVAVAPVLYAAAVWRYAVNVPVGDDYALLASMYQFHVATAFVDKMHVLFSAHNEHRVAVMRVVCWLVERARGSLDFRILLLVGNAVLIVALYQLGRTLDFGGDLFKWALLFLIALQPQYEKLMFYTMANLQVVSGLLFAVLYLRCLFERRRVLWLLLFYLLAVVSSGSGLFLIVIGAPLLACQGRRNAAIVHGLVALAAGYFYVIGFQPEVFTRWGYLIAHPAQIVTFFLQLLGGIAEPPADTGHVSGLPIAFAVLLIGYFVFDLWLTAREPPSDIRTTHIKRLVFLLYIVSVLLLIVTGRTQIYRDHVMDAALDGRYRIHGILFATIALIGALDRIRWTGSAGAAAKAAVVVCAMAFNAGWFYLRLDSMRYTPQARVQEMRDYLARHDLSVLSTWAMKRDVAVHTLDLALAAGLYRP